MRFRRGFASLSAARGDIGGLAPKYFYYICEKSAPFAQKVLKPVILNVSNGNITLKMKYEPFMSGSPQPECLHGGVTAAAIDHAGGMCAISALPSLGQILSTVNLRVDYLNPLPIADGALLLESQIVDYDHNLNLIRTDVTCWNPDKTVKIAIGRCLWNVYDHKQTELTFVKILNSSFQLPIRSAGPMVMKTIRAVQLFRKELLHTVNKRLGRIPNNVTISPGSLGYDPALDTNMYGGVDASTLCSLAETRNAFAREILHPNVSAISPGRLSMRMPFSQQLIGNFSTPCLHGGVAAALIDQCAGYCAKTVLVEANERVSTVTLRLDYLAPAPCFEDTMCDAVVISKTDNLVMVAAECWNHDRTKRLVSGRVWFNIYTAKQSTS